ncbi:hypothetical protein GCM10010123_07020 [Pilimelia anulata]|uniref:Uncharacterized protein n=1 Tax=Pilimelia anulata TaxID=53371 RepID=A0A8J3B7B6_9ACTN|nr:hypothetical protein GCM10010123_07020 [Pilimelia anulata]
MSSTPGQPPLALLDDGRLERAVAVTRDGDLDRTDLGQDGLGPGAVAAVAAVIAHRIALVITEAVAQLAFQPGLQDPLGQLLQQPALPGQLHPRGPGLLHQPADQLAVNPVHRRLRRIDLLRHRGSIHAGRCCFAHQVLLP